MITVPTPEMKIEMEKVLKKDTDIRKEQWKTAWADILEKEESH